MPCEQEADGGNAGDELSPGASTSMSANLAVSVPQPMSPYVPIPFDDSLDALVGHSNRTSWASLPDDTSAVLPNSQPATLTC